MTSPLPQPRPVPPVPNTGPRAIPAPAAQRPYALPPLPHLRLRCVLAARQAAELPEIKGSMLRGAFGQALRRVACVQTADTDCTGCALRAGCAYGRLFENIVEHVVKGQTPPRLTGSKEAPRPYLVEVDDGRRRYAAGDQLIFDLILLGQATDWQGHALMAIDVMAQNGLGARRHCFVLRQVQYQGDAGEWQVGYQRDGQRWQPRPARTVDPVPFGDGPVMLRFTTPTRLMVAKQPVVHFDFRTLAFKMLCRQLDLAYLHCPNVGIDWDFDRYLEPAAAVDLGGGRLRWAEWRRWSNRQRRHITLGGVVGEVQLAGDLEPFVPLLRTAEVVHVGKGATLGFGRVEVVS